MIPNLLCEKWKFKLIKSFDGNKVEKFFEFEERETLTFLCALLSSNYRIRTNIILFVCTNNIVRKVHFKRVLPNWQGRFKLTKRLKDKRKNWLVSIIENNRKYTYRYIYIHSASNPLLIFTGVACWYFFGKPPKEEVIYEMVLREEVSNFWSPSLREKLKPSWPQ